MFYKKWTFSLKILVMLLAIGLVAMPSAMAADFGVSLDMTDDISTDGGLQVAHPGTALAVTVRFDRAVVLAASNISISGFDEDGVYIPSVALAATDPIDPATAAREIALNITVTEATYKVILKIAKGIASDDPFNDDTSAELKQEIKLLAADAGDPEVISIRRVSDPLLPLGKDDTTVQVVITLSELPKEFTKDHVSVDNATHGDPVALDPVVEDPNRYRQLITAVEEAVGPVDPVPELRGLYDGVNRAGTAVTDLTGIHAAIVADTPMALTDALEDYNALVDTDLDLATQLVTTQGTAYLIPIHRPFTVYTLTGSGDVTYPTLTGDNALEADDDADAIEEKIAAAEMGHLSERSYVPVRPVATDYATREAFVNALALYDVLKDVNDLYVAETALRAAYNAAVMAEMDEDDATLAEYIEVELGELVPSATGRDDMLYPYVLTITPKFENKNAIVVRVKEFEDRTYPTPNKYMPPKPPMMYTEGQDQLTIKVNYEKPGAIRTAGIEVHLPHGDAPEIPVDGYFILYRDKDASGIIISGAGDENDATKQTPVQLKYNARAGGSVNLDTFLRNGGTIDLTTTTAAKMGDVVISEVMWGSDAANADSWKSQWIELHNTTASKIVIGEKQWTLRFYGANEALPTSGYIDRVGTRDETNGVFWAPKGQRGVTDVGATTADNPAGVIGTIPLISMQRASSAGTYADGTMASSWSASVIPATNFVAGAEGQRVGTPGAAPPTLPQPDEPETEPDPTPVATASDIKITEIMVDTDNGRFPQWIELTHVGTGEVSLEGWAMVIDNAIDDKVLGGGNAVTVSLSGVTLDVSAHAGNTGKGQSVLLTTWATTRHSANIVTDRVVNLAVQLNQTRRYQLLSYEGFRITLVPPQTGQIADFGDVAGNLDEEWELLMSEAGPRSSLIRREMDKDDMELMGTEANGWVLASATSLIIGQPSYYGNDEDMGTPGHDSGGPLPVELSMFYPKRDKTTGQVVIKWETQSELNNAGFFIKRSQQKDGKFVVINATMIPGAGTTSEKQSYTYTDTTAQPNVVYYYQIEDVSLDGQRQTLTHGTRLRGHIGAAGKATTIWGELKAQE